MYGAKVRPGTVDVQLIVTAHIVFEESRNFSFFMINYGIFYLFHVSTKISVYYEG